MIGLGTSDDELRGGKVEEVGWIGGVGKVVGLVTSDDETKVG